MRRLSARSTLRLLQASAPRAREPKGPGWVLQSVLPAGDRWVHVSTGLQALSSLDNVGLEGGGVEPTWHVSVSLNGRRPTKEQAKLAVDAFDMGAAEEDNHMSGVARQYWLIVEPTRRTDCECKSDETTIVEGDYAYSVPKAEAPAEGGAP